MMEALHPDDMRILDFEQETLAWNRRRRARQIWDRFGMSEFRYTARLAQIIELPAALMYAPSLVAALRRRRDRHREIRQWPHGPVVAAPAPRNQGRLA